MNHIKEYLSESDSEIASDEEDNSIFINNINIYSQNYASNMLGRGSIFLHIPWRPSASTLSLIQNETKNVLSSIPSSSKYRWSDISKVSPLRYHISVYPNIEGDEYKIEQLKKNLAHSLSKLPIERSMITLDQDEVRRYQKLRQVLGEGASPRKYVEFHFRPRLKVFNSTKKDSVFLAGVIDTAGKSGKFFDGIRESIYTNAKSLSLIEKEPKIPEFHISFQLGELKSADDNCDVRELNEYLKDMKVQFEPLKIYISEIVINSIGRLKSTESVKLDL